MLLLSGPSVLAGVVARLRSVWRGLVRRGDMEAEMAAEFAHHLELRAEDLVRMGVSPGQARRQARLEFGHVEGYREDARAARGLRLFDQTRFSWLDVKLGLRMLAKYPVLSVVSVVGIAVAIAIGAGAFGAISSMMDTTLPLPGGDRVVALHNATRNPGNPDRQSVHDFVMWRDELGSVTDLSAFMTDSRNLAMAGGVELVRLAQMSPSGFRVAGVPPALGRPLLDEDEAVGAAPVVVIGHAEWQRRFNGDAGIIGRQVRLGAELHTVVGVMPDGFRFPINHGYWVPLQLNPTEHERGGGPSIQMFGRLADGVTMQEAQAELSTIGARMAAQFPDTHEYLRPRVMPYARAFLDIDSPAMALALRMMQLAISMLLVLVAVNVAVLIYARTATRTGEIAVRSALGASRRRVVTQLFAEALVMCGTAAVIGLMIAGAGLSVTQSFVEMEQDLPFWLHLGMSPGVVLYVAVLTVVAAAIIGVVPGLQATGRQLQGGLQQLSSLGSQMKLGRTWTALIVAQVGIAVAVLPFALYIAGQSLLRGTADAGYDVNRFLRAEISLQREESPPAATAAAYEDEWQARYRNGVAELLRRLQAEPSVAGAAYGSAWPGGGRFRRIEVEAGGATAHRTSAERSSPQADPAVVAGTGSALVNAVDPGLFTLLDVPVLAGRAFTELDSRDGANAVMVDRVFVDRFLGGEALGRRVRVVTMPSQWGPEGRRVIDPEAVQRGPWLEVVGVVPEFTVQSDFDPANPKMYLPLNHADASATLSLAVRLRNGDPRSFAGRLREIAASVDPQLQLHGLASAADAQHRAQRGLQFIALAVGAVTLSVLLLSAAGIYAMMSFTVARRRREIGIRAALGAAPGRVIRSIFRRAGGQVGAGVLAGLLVATAIDMSMGDLLVGTGVLLLPGVALLMVMVGLLAAAVPARRCLAVQPTEALREE